MWDELIHKQLRFPYFLNVRYLHKTPKAKATVLFIHGLGGTGDVWQPVIKSLPDKLPVDLLAIDLLGFGDSPNPRWETYDASIQARSALATFIKLAMHPQVIVVGHSLGTLVSVEFAKRYPKLTKSLILCSPPIYREGSNRLIDQEKFLKKTYLQAAKDPAALVKLYSYATDANLLGPGMNVTNENIDIFIKTLHASIINQTTINDIGKLKQPIEIIYGNLDPLIVRSNLSTLGDKNINIHLYELNVSHIIIKPFSEKIAQIIEQTVAKL